MKIVRDFKKKHRVLHRLVAFVSIACLSWGVWRTLDLFIPGRAEILVVIVVLAALLFLYLDDFHLKELE